MPGGGIRGARQEGLAELVEQLLDQQTADRVWVAGRGEGGELGEARWRRRTEWDIGNEGRRRRQKGRVEERWRQQNRRGERGRVTWHVGCR